MLDNKRKIGMFERDALLNMWLFVAIAGVGLLAAILIPLLSDWRQARLAERCREAGGRFDTQNGKCEMTVSGKKP